MWCLIYPPFWAVPPQNVKNPILDREQIVHASHRTDLTDVLRRPRSGAHTIRRHPAFALAVARALYSPTAPRRWRATYANR